MNKPNQEMNMNFTEIREINWNWIRSRRWDLPRDLWGFLMSVDFPNPPTRLSVEKFLKSSVAKPMPEELRKQVNEWLADQPKSDNQTKALGVPIGAGGNVPDDGDGDGFITLVEGGEDNVPDPSPGDSETPLDEVSRVLLAMDQINSEVEKRFGKITTGEQAFEALQKAFPRTRETRRFLQDFAGRGELLPRQKGAIYGLLYGSIINPKAAKMITKLYKDLKDDAAGRAYMSTTRDGFGFYIQHRQPNVPVYRSESELRQDGRMSFYGPLMVEMARRKIPVDKILEFANMAIALHEYGHVENFVVATDTLGITDPTDAYDVLNRTVGLSKEAVARWIDMEMTAVLKERDAQPRGVVEDFPNIWSDEAIETGVRKRVIQIYADDIWDAITKAASDHLSRTEVDSAWSAMSQVSPYAGFNWFEAVAEYFAAQLFVDVPVNPEVDKFSKQMRTKSARVNPKKTRPTVKNGVVEFPFCSGIFVDEES